MDDRRATPQDKQMRDYDIYDAHVLVLQVKMWVGSRVAACLLVGPRIRRQIGPEVKQTTPMT